MVDPGGDRGKHVLCEKPVARTVAEARRLLEARDEYGVKIGEAFMVRSHPSGCARRNWCVAGASENFGQRSAYSATST